jgi:hypothetical protein
VAGMPQQGPCHPPDAISCRISTERGRHVPGRHAELADVLIQQTCQLGARIADVAGMSIDTLAPPNGQTQATPPAPTSSPSAPPTTPDMNPASRSPAARPLPLPVDLPPASLR